MGGYKFGRDRLPQYLTPQVGPQLETPRGVGGQLILEDGTLEDVVPNRERILFAEFAPHLGHLISWSLSVMLRRRSNFSPHFVHSYSYMGILQHSYHKDVYFDYN